MDECTYPPNSCHSDVMGFQNSLIFSSVLYYAKNGSQILPLHSVNADGSCTCQNLNCRSSGKHPLTKNGLKDASGDLQQLERWWGQFPFANIGILTGANTNLVVLDIDLKSDGFRSLELLEQQHSKLPKSRRVTTGGGGLHIYFSCSGSQLKNRVNILPGIDFRGDGGYIVAPPSRHASGKMYQWLDKDQTLERMPDWLENIIQDRQTLTTNPSPLKLTSIKEGNRNNSLASIGGFLLAKGIESIQLEQILLLVNQSAVEPPLDQSEVHKLAMSLSKYEREHTWNDPSPLPTLKIMADKLHEHQIPAAIKDWTADIAERMQVPLEFVVAPALILAATLIGRKVGIKPLKNDDWTVIPNLWGFLVAEPGSMKSPAISAVMKMLDQIENKERKHFQSECMDVQKKDKARRLEIESLKQALKIDFKSDFLDSVTEKQLQIQKLEEDQIDQEEVKEKRYKTNDPTVEKLALLLKDNPQGMLLLRDELSGWLESLHRAGREGNKEFYLETWNGNSSFSVDRIGRGSVHIEALCLSIFGGIQPAKLNEYIEKHSTEAGDDGFLERFQIVFYPECRESFQLIDRKPNQNASQKAFEIMDFLDSITGYNQLNFSTQGQALADAWRRELEARILTEKLSPIYKAHISKYRSLAPSLALIFSLLKHAPFKKIPENVGVESVQMAIEWCSLLESHIRKVYSETIHDPLHASRLLADKIQKHCVFDGDKLRDILRHNWKGLKTSDGLMQAIHPLSELNWVRVQTFTARGGSSEVLRINPRLPSGNRG